MVDYVRFLSRSALEVRASEIREILKLTESSDIISLAGGLPAPETFAVEELAEVAYKVISEYGVKALQYAPTKGVALFIEALRDFLVSHGVTVKSDDEIVVTVGSQEALYLTGRVFLDPGDCVVVEEPSYLGALQVFSLCRARFIPVPMTDSGMDLDELEAALKRARSDNLRVKLLYTMPTCHNPTGITVPEDHRKRLLELAEEYDLIVVEDDPYSFIAFEPLGARPLKTLDKSGRVLYMGTMSKILAPGLRLGWIVGPREVMAKYELLKQFVNLHTSTLSQYIAAEALKAGVVQRRLNLIKSVYKRKRDAMLEALEEYMPEGCTWTKPKGGLFVWAWLPEKVDARELLRVAISKKVAFVPGDAFYVTAGKGRNTMRLNYSLPTPERIREGVRRLSEALREVLSGTQGLS